MLTQALSDHFERLLGTRIGNVRRLGGGDISTALSITTANGNQFFVKLHPGHHGRSMLQAEARGLELLRSANALVVPEVFHEGYLGTAYLITEQLTPRSASETDWEDFGRMLALLHRTTAGAYGLDHDNYIGSLNQGNVQNADWPLFYSGQRIAPMMRQAEAYLSTTDQRNWADIETRLNDLIPCDTPSLIHGDLWNGNAMWTTNGPAIYDPAVGFCDRVMDLAMAKLFGGFPDVFFNAYLEAWPVDQEILNTKIQLYQLYYFIGSCSAVWPRICPIGPQYTQQV